MVGRATAGESFSAYAGRVAELQMQQGMEQETKPPQSITIEEVLFNNEKSVNKGFVMGGDSF